jgi:hypothetical protein
MALPHGLRLRLLERDMHIIDEHICINSAIDQRHCMLALQLLRYFTIKACHVTFTTHNITVTLAIVINKLLYGYCHYRLALLPLLLLRPVVHENAKDPR